MQAACEAARHDGRHPLGLDDKTVEEICASIGGVVVAANYNCPGQLVISGAVEAWMRPAKAKAAGARRASASARGRCVPLAADGAGQAGLEKGD